MTIEIRQLLIKSQVLPGPHAARPSQPAARELEQLRQRVLAECKAWLAERLPPPRER